MFRRISLVIVAAALVAATLPSAAFADEHTTSTSSRQLARVATALQTPRALDLRHAQQGVALSQEAARQQSGSFFSTPRGKGTIAAAVVVAAIGAIFAVSKGPDPTPATAR